MILPDRILTKMDKADRPRGKSGMTVDEFACRLEASSERELHDQVEAWLRRNGIPYVHARTDRKSTIQAGWPDFTAVYNGRVACIELKTETGIVSGDQERVIDELRRARVPVRVCRTLAEATHFLKVTLLDTI